MIKNNDLINMRPERRFKKTFFEKDLGIKRLKYVTSVKLKATLLTNSSVYLASAIGTVPQKGSEIMQIKASVFLSFFLRRKFKFLYPCMSCDLHPYKLR